MQVEAVKPTSITVARSRLDDIERQVADLQTSLKDKLHALTGDAKAVLQVSSDEVAGLKAKAQ